MRVKKIILMVVIVILLIALAGCSEAPAEPPKPVESKASVPVVPDPAPEVEVVWFDVFKETGYTYIRFLAEIKNPGPEPLVGVTTEWIAYDKDNTMVGSFSGERVAIMPGTSIFYAGGASDANLTGKPVSVKVSIKDKGHFDNSAIDPRLAVSNTKITKGYEWTVQSTVTNHDKAEESSKFDGVAVVKNKDGKIVYADFIGNEYLPETIPANESFKIKFEFIPKKPVAAEVYAYME